MNDHLISRSRFLDALVLDADNKTDLIQVHQALEKAVISPDEVRGVGEWIEYHADYKCTACGETVKDEIFYMLDPYRLPTYCPNCGARMKGAEDEL